MAFLSCEEMLAAARTQNISLAEAVLRSDLAESRLTEEQSRHGMRHLWHVMEATSRDYDPAQRSFPAATPPKWNRRIGQAGATAAITWPR